MKYWKFCGARISANLIESSKNDDYIFGEKMKNLIFSLVYYEESPELNLFSDLIVARKMSNCFLISHRLREILFKFSVFSPHLITQCIVSNGIEEREYFLLFINGGILENIEYEVDFINSIFAVHNKITMELYESLERGFIKDAQFVRDETRRVIQKDKFGVGRKIRIWPKELVFKRRVDYLFLPGCHYPVVSDRLKEYLLKGDITGFDASLIFDDYSIHISETEN